MRARLRAVQQLFRLQAEPLDGLANPGPLFAKKLPPFALQQQGAGAWNGALTW
jgi:hypothetical protein